VDARNRRSTTADPAGEQAGNRVARDEAAADGVEQALGVTGLRDAGLGDCGLRDCGDRGLGPPGGVDCPAGGAAGLGEGHARIIGPGAARPDDSSG